MSTTIYQQRQQQFQQQADQLARLRSTLSMVRLLCFVGAVVAGIYYYKTQHLPLLVLGILLLVLFFVLVHLYNKKGREQAFAAALAKVNQQEADFLQTGKKFYHHGAEHINPHHPYSYDIDLFGEHAFFHFLNRSTSLFGNNQLAQALTQPNIDQITERQQAIALLKEKLEFRHNLAAHGLEHPLQAADIEQIKSWLASPNTLFGRPVWRVLMFLAPAAFLISMVAYLAEWLPNGNLPTYLFLFNLLLLGQFYKMFSKQLSLSGSLSKSLLQLAAQFSDIEKEKFTSPLLQQLQQQLFHQQMGAATSIKKLASLFSNLNSISNLPASMALNGTILFHLHVFYAIEKWKAQQQPQLFAWLQCLGEMEALSSFANFAYNNTGFVFPQTSTTENLSATDLGHPLIAANKRTCNNISLQQEKFIVLTGSNMSGKSTFLRTLALNLVLARAGSVVCATQFQFYPYDIFVSMRISDSLLDNESFFYAELKRLQSIVHHVQAGNKTFVLLDEILRGTNSNDKHSGTVGLIKKLAAMRICGLIATHDVTIGDLSTQYPGYMANKCFEAQIVNDELLFDYRLKDGICQKLSASFLMKKMEIID